MFEVKNKQIVTSSKRRNEQRTSKHTADVAELSRPWFKCSIVLLISW